MDEELMSEAQSLGINDSMYYLLPVNQREDALRSDIVRAKERIELDG